MRFFEQCFRNAIVLPSMRKSVFTTADVDSNNEIVTSTFGL